MAKQVGTLFLCDCAGSQSVDGASAASLGLTVQTASRLCTAEVASAEAALAGGAPVVIACAQQAAQFADLAQTLDAGDRLTCVDIRDRAGWTDAGKAHAKQAALLAEALLPVPPTPAREVISEGVCLVIGGAAALEIASALADELAVTCLLSEALDDLVPDARFDVALGRVRNAAGALGAFEVVVDGYAPAEPAGRGAMTFREAVDGAASRCDIIVDLSRNPPLFPAHHKRNGYLRSDPGDVAGRERTVRAALALQGTFEQPRYVRFHEDLCAHSRAGQPGCTRCLDVCPTGAIASAGETVAIDPAVCAGCGACSAVCPSGAASFDDPPFSHLLVRLRTLADTFAQAGGANPRALFHDLEHGGEMIALSARFGRGLPPDVVPIAVENVTQIGHAELVSALSLGFCEAMVLVGPKSDRAVLDREAAIADAIASGTGQPGRIALIEPADPDALEEALWRAPVAPATEPSLILGGRREATRLAATALAAGAIPAPIALPDGAVYGAVNLDREACTLCLACVSLCPSGALADNPDKPEVRFQEAACLQCGICEATCPENAIALEPRLDLSNSAMAHRTLNEEEPFACVSCGTPFGVKSTIERIVAKLEGQHSMFTHSSNVELIKMCNDCRVKAQYHSENSPFRMGERPRPRTTDDYKRDKTLN